MKLNKNTFLLILVLLMAKNTFSQEVKSKPYDLMLRTMLSRNVEEVDVESAKLLKDAVFVDAREAKEYQVSHIRNALWVGYDNQDLSSLEKTPKNKTLVVYCSVGYRSEKTVEKLNQMGFKNVYNLYGGIFEWVNQGNPVYKKEEQTNQVHAFNRIWGVWLNKGEKIYE